MNSSPLLITVPLSYGASEAIHYSYHICSSPFDGQQVPCSVPDPAFNLALTEVPHFKSLNHWEIFYQCTMLITSRSFLGHQGTVIRLIIVGSWLKSFSKCMLRSWYFPDSTGSSHSHRWFLDFYKSFRSRSFCLLILIMCMSDGAWECGGVARTTSK